MLHPYSDINNVISLLDNIKNDFDNVRTTIHKSDYLSYEYDFSKLYSIMTEFNSLITIYNHKYISEAFVRNIKLKIINMQRLSNKKEIDIFQLINHLDLFSENDDYSLNINTNNNYKIIFSDKALSLLKTFNEYDYRNIVVNHFQLKHNINISDSNINDDTLDLLPF